MAGRIHPDDIRALRERADLASVAGDYTTLRRSGATFKGLCPFHEEKTPSFHVDSGKGMWHCFSRDTGVMTWYGTFPIGKLAGTTQPLLTRWGGWTEAPVMEFGRQRLFVVDMTRNHRRKRIFATPEHVWFVRKEAASGVRNVERCTADLEAGDPLAFVFPAAHRFRGHAPSPFGVAHGFTFGDGTLEDSGARVHLCGAKDEAMRDYFPVPFSRVRNDVYRSPGILPRFFCETPSLDEAPNYLYGWLAGYFAAEGCVSKDGQVMLNSARREVLEFVRTAANRLGIGTHSVRSQMRTGFGRQPSELCVLTFLSSSLTPEFFLIPEHRERFEATRDRAKRERKGWIVDSVTDTGIEDDVYCAVVPRTHSFALEDNIHVQNCFGCSEGGDVYGLLQKTEALSFPEAVEHLARREGVSLRYEQLSPGERKAMGRRTRLTEVTEAAAAWFAEQLAGEDGKAAREYLAARGIDAETQRRFELGWAPDRWDGLVRALREQGFADAELIDAGVASEGRRGPIDRFRGRVMFPIHDRSGRAPIAFGGRVLPGVELTTAGRDAEPPKYINSPETEIYKKSQILYGLAQARAEIQRRQTALIVEGYTDVIALHVVGFEHAVATCGTSLTAEHFRQLERYGRRVVLALDADDAGYRAAERARELAADVGVRELSVLPLPPGTDPADLAAQGREAVEAAFADVRTATEFQLEHLLRTTDTDTPEAQAEAYRATFPLLAGLSDRSLRYRYIRDVVAPAVRLSADRIERDLDDALATGRVDASGGAAGSSSAASDAAAGGGTAPVSRLAGRAGEPKDPQLRLERQVLQVALQRPEQLPDEWHEVTGAEFTTDVSRQLWEVLGRVGLGDLDAVLQALPTDDDRARVRALALAPCPVPDDLAHVADLVRRLRAASYDREIRAVHEEMRTLNPDTDGERVEELFARRSELERQRRALAERQGA